MMSLLVNMMRVTADIVDICGAVTAMYHQHVLCKPDIITPRQTQLTPSMKQDSPLTLSLYSTVIETRLTVNPFTVQYSYRNKTHR